MNSDSPLADKTVYNYTILLDNYNGLLKVLIGTRRPVVHACRYEMEKQIR